MKTIIKIWKSRDLRKKIFFVVLLLIAYRLIVTVPIPIEASKGVIDAIAKQGKLGGAFDILELVSGGALSQFSIAAMGVGPYITASIIVQLVTKAIPALSALQKEGEYGRQKITQYTRLLTVPIAALQGIGVVNILKQFAAQFGVPFNLTGFDWFVVLLSLTAGTMLVMWIGEMISAKQIGNGISLIIFIGIVARLVPSVVQSYQTSQGDPSYLFNMLIFTAVALVVVFLVVFITEGVRNLPVSYARAVRGQSTYQRVQTSLPLKVNMAGVIPIIFAVAVVSVPGTLGTLLGHAKTRWLADASNTLSRTFATTGNTYWIVYFLLVIGFTYFSTYLYFHPKEVAENLQKQGGYIPGTRPGTETAGYLSSVINRISLFGSLFLGLIAILPFLLEKFKLVEAGNQALAIGGTGLLIVISVVIETVRAVRAQLLLRSYEDA